MSHLLCALFSETAREVTGVVRVATQQWPSGGVSEPSLVVVRRWLVRSGRRVVLAEGTAKAKPLVGVRPVRESRCGWSMVNEGESNGQGEAMQNSVASVGLCKNFGLSMKRKSGEGRG